MCAHRSRKVTVRETWLSSTGIRGTLTMPDSMASISEKSLTTHGKIVPSG